MTRKTQTLQTHTEPSSTRDNAAEVKYEPLRRIVEQKVSL